MKKTHDGSVEGQPIHVGDGGKNRKRQLRLILAVGGGLVLVAGCVAAVMFWQSRSGGDAAMQAAIDEKVSDIQDQTLAGDYDKAHENIQKSLGDPSLSDKAKLALYMQEGAAYENQQNYAAAIESYQKAEAIEPSMGIIQAVATLAMRIDNKQLAIDYYNKALDFLAENDDLSESSKQYFEGLIKDLEGQSQ